MIGPSECGNPGSAVTLTHGVRIEPRPYDDPDAATLVNALYAEQVDTYGYADLPDRDVAQDYDPPHGLFLVAYGSDGLAVGCGGVRTYDRQERVAEVRKMYVRLDWRGRGIGRLVLERLEAHAADDGARRLILETGDLNDAAIRLYAATGYEPIPSYVSGRRESNRAFAKQLG